MEAALPSLFGVGCAVLVALIVLLAVLNVRRERRRRDRLYRWAHRHGWTVTANPAVDWGAHLPGGNRRGVSLALTGVVDGRVVSVAEYSYSESNTSTTPDGVGGTTTSTTTQTHHFVVTVVRLAHPYPPISVRPRGTLSKLGRALLGGGAAASGDPAFDRRFTVATADPALAGRLISPALVAEHLAGTVPPWSLHGPELITCQRGRLDDPDRILALAAPSLRVAFLLRV